jgi:serine protease
MRCLIERYTRLRNMTPIMRCLLPLSLVLMFAGCGGGDNGDKTAPAVTITSPTGNSTYDAAATPLTIGGTASDNKGVSAVTWSSSSGGSGTCTGTKSWTANIPLTAGTNTITVTAKDTSGNTGTDTLTVTYLPITLSGMITVPSTNMVDSDVNDPNQTYTPNNTIATAQLISNPVTLGGCVNVAGSGVPGRSYSSGDTDDYFMVSLSAGDTISLSIADYDNNNSSAADLDLYIKDSSGTVVAYSLGPSSSESRTTSDIENFTANSTYYINVHADSGASNYVLSIGNQASVITSHALTSSSEFVPRQVIIRFKDGTTSIPSVKKLSDHLSSIGLGLKAGKPGKEALASFDVSKQTSIFKTLGIEDKLDLKAVDDKSQKKLDTLHIIKALRKRSDVETADPNYILHPVAIPNDEYYSYQWNLPLINLPETWDITTGSTSVIVAVVDTGVLMNHPDLSGKLTNDGYDFISDPSISNDGGGIDNDPDDPGDGDNTDGTSSFHGTHVAGIIAAKTDNTTGVAGVGWSALTLIRPVRVMGKGGGTDYDVLQGVRYSAGLDNDSDTTPSVKADIINLSLGGDTYSATDEAVFAEVRKAGVIVIAAAGNNASSTSFYPASYDGVVSVSAVDINGDLASYSNYGSDVDVAAPGGDSGDLNGDGYPDYVLSTCGDDSAHIENSSKPIEYDYVFMAGTSMAAPHVAGVAALMKAVRPALTPDDFDQYLAYGDLTDDVGDTGKDEYYGYGLIDAYKAVVAASSGEVPTVLTVSPSALNFGASSDALTLTVSHLGADTLGVASVSDDATWLTVSASSVDSTTGLGTYTVKVDRTSLSTGAYSATITFTASNSSTFDVQVKMTVGSSGIEADSGIHYVLLVDTTGTREDRQVQVEAVHGAYAYTFTDVPKGTYEIYAGSDRDNDYYIGDAGESFGAYMTASQPTEITADKDLSGLDFSTDYLMTLSGTAGIAETRTDYFIKRINNINKQVNRYTP